MAWPERTRGGISSHGDVEYPKRARTVGRGGKKLRPLTFDFSYRRREAVDDRREYRDRGRGIPYSPVWLG